MSTDKLSVVILNSNSRCVVLTFLFCLKLVLKENGVPIVSIPVAVLMVTVILWMVSAHAMSDIK